jgi:hypothetical protein
MNHPHRTLIEVYIEIGPNKRQDVRDSVMRILRQQFGNAISVSVDTDKESDTYQMAAYNYLGIRRSATEGRELMRLLKVGVVPYVSRHRITMTTLDEPSIAMSDISDEEWEVFN